MTDETAVYIRLRGEVVRVDGRSVVFGRSHSCDVQVDEDGVSRRHCELIIREDGASVRDLGSTYGTFVDDRRLRGEIRIQAAARVQLGENGPHFELVSAIVHGRPVLGTSAPRRASEPKPVVPRVVQSPGSPEPHTSETTPIAPETVAAALAPAAPRAGHFGLGLAAGLAAGIALALAALRFIR